MNALAATVTDDAEGRIPDALLARGRLKEGDWRARGRCTPRPAAACWACWCAWAWCLNATGHRPAPRCWACGCWRASRCRRPAAGAGRGLPLSLRFLKQFHVCPLELNEHGVRLWLADAHDAYPQQAVQLALGFR